MRLTQALAKFTVQLQADGRSPHTIEQYRRHVNELHRWLEGQGRTTDVPAIDHEVLARFLASPQTRVRADGQTKRASSMNVLRTSIRCFFRYLADAGITAVNPARLIRRARCGPPLPRALGDDDQKRLLQTLAAAQDPHAARDHALIHLMLATGIRIGSALGLLVRDVDLVRGEILLRHAKGDRESRVFMGDAISQHLRDFLKGRRQGPVFEGRRGKPLCTRRAQQRLAVWQARAGVERPVSPHGLRHSFAVGLYRATRDLLAVKEALGHASIASTLIYLGCVPAQGSAALARRGPRGCEAGVTR